MARITVVVPVYYNSASLPPLLERLQGVASELSRHEFEFVFVDDGSGDDSFDVARKLALQEHRLTVVRLSRNFGANQALTAGLSVATGDCVGAIAADLQDPPETLIKMIEAWEDGNKVVFAVRHDRHGDPVFTRLFAYIFNWLYRTFVMPEIALAGLGFFVIDRQVARLIVDCSEKNSHIFGFILWAGFRRAFIPYERSKRGHGSSRWTFSKKLTYFIDAFVAFSYLPLRLASIAGILLSLTGFLYSVVILAARLMGNVPIRGWATLTILVLLTSGVQMLMLGILGEYLWRTLEVARKRPAHIIDVVRSGGIAPTDKRDPRQPGGLG